MTLLTNGDPLLMPEAAAGGARLVLGIPQLFRCIRGRADVHLGFGIAPPSVSKNQCEGHIRCSSTYQTTRMMRVYQGRSRARIAPSAIIHRPAARNALRRQRKLKISMDIPAVSNAMGK